jgi:hypothetical protein
MEAIWQRTESRVSTDSAVRLSYANHIRKHISLFFKKCHSRDPASFPINCSWV